MKTERKMKKMADEYSEFEEPPGTRRPPHPWEQVPPEEWNDWRWQLAHRLNSVQELSKVVNLTPEEVAAELRIKVRTLRAMCSRQEIAFHRLGRLLRFSRADLDAFLARSRRETKRSGRG